MNSIVVMMSATVASLCTVILRQFANNFTNRDEANRREMKRLDKKRKKREAKEAKEKAKKIKWIKKHTERYYEGLWNELKDLVSTRMEINKPCEEPLPSDNVRKLGACREDRIILEIMNNKESQDL